MRKQIVAGLLLAMLALAGCGSEDEAPRAGTTPTAPAATTNEPQEDYGY
jgi:hypothetical protein